MPYYTITIQAKGPLGNGLPGDADQLAKELGAALMRRGHAIHRVLITDDDTDDVTDVTVDAVLLNAGEMTVTAPSAPIHQTQLQACPNCYAYVVQTREHMGEDMRSFFCKRPTMVQPDA